MTDQSNITVKYYCEGTDKDSRYSSPQVTSIIKYGDIDMEWTIGEACYSTNDWNDNLGNWKSIKQSLQSGENLTKNGQGGGGNSSWECCADNGRLKLMYDISGSGGDSTYIIYIPANVILPIIDSLILVCEHANRNEKYIPSTIATEDSSSDED